MKLCSQPCLKLPKNVHLSCRVEAARKRQEELARQRLAARRGKHRTSADVLREQGDVPMPEDEDDIVGLQEAVMREIERKHSEERELLMQVKIILCIYFCCRQNYFDLLKKF